MPNFSRNTKKDSFCLFGDTAELSFFILSKHGAIIRTGITCKKIPCCMRDSACKWFIVKKLKYFENMLNFLNCRG